MRGKSRVPNTMFILLSLLLTGLAGTSVQAEQPAGKNVIVGSFKIDVEIDERSVEVERRTDNDDDDDDERQTALPSVQLLARFGNWDRQNRTASIIVALRNISAANLFAPLRALIIRISPRSVGVLNPDGGSGPGSWAFFYDSDALGGAMTLRPGATSGEKLWEFLVPFGKDEFEVRLDILAGVPIPAGAGATIQGPGGTSLMVPPNSVPYEALVDINPVPVSSISAPLGALVPVGAVELTFQPVEFNASLIPPSMPFHISVPVPLTSTATQFIVAQAALTDFVSGPSSGLREQLVAVDTAARFGADMVTEATVFPGIFRGGTFVFVENTGSGFAAGTVSDATGPRPGVTVSNSTNTLVAVTNGAGIYKLYISGGPFTVTGFDPFRGSSGSAAGSIVTSGSTVVADIFLSPLAAPPIIRDGIRNGGFERGNVTSWARTGAAAAIRGLGPTSTGTVIQPTEGQWMADINTGPGAAGGVGSSLMQRFVVPAGVRTLRLDFNFVSEEFPEFVGSIFDDAFRAIITTPNGQSTFAQVSVNNSGGFALIGDCFFPGGDSTCGQTGWREGSVDLSAFAGANTPIEVELLFTANDAGDNIYDTHVLVDNIRFSTLWLDAKIIQGADRDAIRIHQEVQEANEILSQAGINIRVRNTQIRNDPGGLLDLEFGSACEPPADPNCRFVPTAEEDTLMGLARSLTPTDVNAYYVRVFTQNGQVTNVAGLAITPEDFLNVEILVNAGAIIASLPAGCLAGEAPPGVRAGGRVLAHELGHLLISRRAGNVLEHGAGPGNFMSFCNDTGGMLNRVQSNNNNLGTNTSAMQLLLP